MKQGSRPAQAVGLLSPGGLLQTPSRELSSLHTSPSRSHTSTGSLGVPAGFRSVDPDDEQATAAASTSVAM